MSWVRLILSLIIGLIIAGSTWYIFSALGGGPFAVQLGVFAFFTGTVLIYIGEASTARLAGSLILVIIMWVLMYYIFISSMPT